MHPAAHVDPHDGTTAVTGKEAAQPFHAAVGDSILVPVAGQQGDFFLRVAGGQLLVGRRPDRRLDVDPSVSTVPSVARLTSITSFS